MGTLEETKSIFSESKEMSKQLPKRKDGNFFADRIVSPFWGSFALAEIILHWEIIYVTFFQDPDLLFESIHKTKIEFVENYLNSFKHTLDFLHTNIQWIDWLFNPLSVLLSTIGFPLLVVYVFIWLVPRISNRVLRRYEEDKVEQLKIKRDTWKDIDKEKVEKEVDSLEKETEKYKEIIDKYSDTVKKVEKIQKENKLNKQQLTEEQRWDLDFEDFKKNASYYKGFGSLINIIEPHDSFKTYNNYTKLDSLLKNYIFSLDLFDIQEEAFNSPGAMTLTNKGKYFVKKYVNSHQYTDLRDDIPMIKLD